MRRNRSILTITTIFLSFFALAIGHASRGNSSPVKVNQKELLHADAQIDPNTYDEVSGSDLTAKITSCTATSLSRRITVQFDSKTISAFFSDTEDVGYVVDDPNFTGERNNPFKVPQDGKQLSGYTYCAEAKDNSQSTLYISNIIHSGSRFDIANLKIAANAMYKEVEHDVSTGQDVVKHDSYKNLTTIYICDGVKTVESGAIVNVPDTVTIKCVANEKPAGWADDWTDAANVLWGQQLDVPSKAEVDQYGGAKSFGEAKDFILGYAGSEEYGFGAYPLTLSYKKVGSDTPIFQEIPTKHKTNPYDAVGSKIYGDTNSFDIIVDLEKGDDIDPTSFEFYNIFNAKRLYTNKKVSWPVEAVNTVLDKYAIPKDIDGMEEGFIPTLSGDSFFYQLFESESDDYLTIAQEFDSEEAANALLNTYKDKITSFTVDKDIFSSNEDLTYTHLEEYTDDRYGSVYKLFFEREEAPVNIFIQAYVVHNENIGKYEFVTYIILDKPIREEKENEDGTKEVSYTKNSRSLPFSNLQIAIRPFVFVPDYVVDPATNKNVPSEMLKAGGMKRFTEVIWVDNILTTKFLSASRFLDYTSLSIKADKVLETVYAGYLADASGGFDMNGKMKVLLRDEEGTYYYNNEPQDPDEVTIVGSFKAPSVYVKDASARNYIENNLANILEKKIVFRFTFSSLNLASLVVTYKKNGVQETTKIPVKSPSPVFEVPKEKGNVLSFMVSNSALKGVDTSAITAVGLSGATINIHLFNNETNNLVQNTAKLQVFGNIEILPQVDSGLSFFNINGYLLLFFGALTLIYVILAVALFFYKKNKYKNDEFRRMRPKAYIKSAALGYLGLALILAALNFIVLRFALFNSSIPTYNPIDAFVIVFSIMAAISIGLFIKNFATAVKLAKKRREIKRLQLDKDVADDGTK